MKAEEVRKLLGKLEKEMNPENRFKEGNREIRWQFTILRANYPFLFKMIERIYGLERNP